MPKQEPDGDRASRSRAVSKTRPRPPTSATGNFWSASKANFDPEAFDVAAVNEELQPVR